MPDDIAGIERPDEADGATEFLPLGESLEKFEREYLLDALAATGGKRTRTAELLGVSRKNLWEKLRAHGIRDEEIEGASG